MDYFKTADLVDDYQASLRFCDLDWLKLGQRGGFHGPIATVKCFEDNSILHGYLAEPGEGRVMVVDGGGSTRCAVVGDVVAKLAQDNGWAGLVINGAIRDLEAIDAMDFAVFAQGSSPMRSAKRNIGDRDVPVSFGNLAFVPGQYLYADADGILVADGAVHG